MSKWQQQEFEMSSADFEHIQQLAYQLTGIVLPDRKKQMVYSRLSRRIRNIGIASVTDYCRLLDSDKNEHTHFINALTTNLTAFFREKHHFDFLENVITPLWLKNRKRRLRIWSAACSTGEEPYSIAMSLCSQFNTPEWDLKILATDLDTQVLEVARKGLYRNEILDSIPERFTEKYIKSISRSDHFQIKQRIMDMVHFKQLNLLSPWPMKGKFDIIFCRNVFIYFDIPTKRRIIEKFRQYLTDDGFLIIGHSETLNQLSNDFTFVGKTIYQAKPTKNN